MIITRATNVWIKFIAFVNDMWKKRIFEVFILQGNTWNYYLWKQIMNN